MDRTAHIRLVEEAGKQLLFLRPRRFGKSLWLSTLENYYDVAKADEFETLFGHLAIGQDPTPRHNQYFVLKWDFSAVSPMGEAREIRDALHRYVNVCIQDFAVTYQALLPREIVIEPEDALISFQSLLTAIRQTPYRLYLLIDEYDNAACATKFANEVMMGQRAPDQARYQALLYGEGALKTLFDESFMLSLLYYFGVLTLAGKTPLGKLILKIPNLVVRELYVERIQEMLLPDLEGDRILQIAETFYSTGDIQPVCDFVEQRYFKVFDNRDYRWANELTIKTAFLTLLFNDLFYIMDSEPALARDYADLVMIVRPDMRQYQLLDVLIEFKYVGLSDAELSGAEAQALSGEEVRALLPVQQKLAESDAKLTRYRQVLEATYGDALRLRTYSVVALGFDRLAWAEVNGDHA